MNNIYNSIKEVSLRVLSILYIVEKPMSLDSLVAYDFLAVYGKEFNVSDTNLHGDNLYKYSELTARNIVIEESLKHLVLDSFVIPNTFAGFKYEITDDGIEYINNFSSNYFINYTKNLKKIMELYSNVSDNDLIKMIQRKSTINI